MLAILVSFALIGGGVAFGLGLAQQGGGNEEIEEPLAQKNHNELLEDTAKEVSGFGGLYRDKEDKTIVYVYMMDTSNQEDAERAARMLLGDRPISKVITVQADFTMTQIAEWYRLLRPEILDEIDGVQSSGISEGKNRITVGLVTSDSKDQVEKKLTELGIPREAVIIEVKGPIERLRGSLLEDGLGPV